MVINGVYIYIYISLYVYIIIMYIYIIHEFSVATKQSVYELLLNVCVCVF